MPNNNETTTKFKVDISELKKAMQDAKRQISVANSEFKEAASSMDDWSKSSDGLSAKLKQLDSNLKSQKTILSNLEKQYEAVVAEQGEGSAAADKLKIAINNQKATINKTEREISNYESALEEVSEAEKKAAKTGKSVAEVLDQVDDKANEASDGFTVLKGAIATFAGNALTGFANGIKSAIGSMVGLAEETREYRNEMAKLETAFETAGHSTETASKTYEELYGILGDEGQAVEAANFLAKLTDNEKDLAKWTDIAAGVYGTFGTSLPIESLTEAANETQKTGALTGALADALNWAGVSEEEFQASLDKCNNEQERQELIMNTLNGLYSEAADGFKETNKSVIDANKANADYQETLAAMGEKVEPVMTTLKQGVTGLLQEFLKLIGDVDISVFTTKIEEAFAILTNTVLPAVKEGLGWIIDNKDILIAALAGIAGGFVAFKVVGIIQGLVSAFKAWQIATEGMTVAQRLLNLVIKANPIGIIISLIVGLVAAFVVLWNKSDKFREFWINLWDKIKNACKKAIEGIGKFFTETLPKFFKSCIDWIKKNWQAILLFLINPFAGLFKYFYDNNKKFKEFVDTAVKYVKELPSKIWTWLQNTINKVTTWRDKMVAKAKETATNFVNKVVDFVKELPSKVWTWLTNVVTKVGTWGTNLAAKGKQAAKDLFDAVVDKVKELPDKIKSIGSDLVTGLWNGIKDMASWIKEKIEGFGEGILEDLKDFFGIASPSKVMAKEVGRWLPEGMAVGIDKNAKSVLTSMRDMSAQAVGAARGGLTGATGVSGGSSTGGIRGGVVNNFTQVINSPKQLSRLDIYRQSKNLLGFCGGVS